MDVREALEAALPLGPAKPLAEWTLAEYTAALDAAGVREELAAQFEEHHAETMRLVTALLTPLPRRRFLPPRR